MGLAVWGVNHRMTEMLSGMGRCLATMSRTLERSEFKMIKRTLNPV